MSDTTFGLGAAGTFLLGVAAIVNAAFKYRDIRRREHAARQEELRLIERSRILNGAPEVIDRAIPLIIQAIYVLAGLGDETRTRQLTSDEFKRMEAAAYIIGMLRGLPAASTSQNKGKTQG